MMVKHSETILTHNRNRGLPQQPDKKKSRDKSSKKYEQTGKNREPEVVFVSEKKQKEYPHRPRKEIDMDQYLILYRQGLPNRQIASRLKVSPRTLYRRMEEERKHLRRKKESADG